MGIFYKILSFFFGPNDRATAKHLAETAKRQDPFAEFVERQWNAEATKPLPSINVNKAKLADPLGDYINQTLENDKKSVGVITVSGPGLSPCAFSKAISEEMVKALAARGEAFSTAKSIAPPVEPSKKQAILSFIKSHSPAGITAEKVGKAFPAWRYSTITARISELYKAGTIVSVGTANTGSGSLASLFAVAK